MNSNERRVFNIATLLRKVYENELVSVGRLAGLFLPYPSIDRFPS